MSTIGWIVTGGLLMSAIAMTGGLATVLSPRALESAYCCRSCRSPPARC